MASVFKRGNRFFLRVKDEFTGAWTKIPSDARTKTAALALARKKEELNEQIRLGFAVRPTDMTFDELADLWLERHMRKLPSYETEKARLELHLRPRLGKLPLTRVTTLELDGLFTDLLAAEDAHAIQTVHHLRGIVRRMFNAAIRWRKWADKNPASATVCLLPPVPEHTPMFARAEHIPMIIATAKGEFQLLSALAIYTGLREGELLELERTRVAPACAAFEVERSVGRDTTKGKKARIVPIPAEVRPLLARHLDDLEGDYLFPEHRAHKSPRVLIGRTLRATLIAAGLIQRWEHRCRRKGCLKVVEAKDPAPRSCEACKMKLWAVPIPMRLTFHALRHTYCTQMLARGADIRKVQVLAGHSDIRTTLRYTHLVPGYLEEEAGRMVFGEIALPALRSELQAGTDGLSRPLSPPALMAALVSEGSSGSAEIQAVEVGVPGGIRTRVTGLKGQFGPVQQVAAGSRGLGFSAGYSASVGPPVAGRSSAALKSCPALCPHPEQWLSVRAVAARLSLSTATVYALCEGQQLPHLRLPNNQIRVDPGQLEAFIDGCRRGPR